MPLLVPVFIVVGHILVLILERAPAVKVVPKIVELLHFLFLALVVSQSRDGLCLAEAPLGDKDGIPELEKVALLCLFLRRRFNVSSLVYRIKLAAFDRVEQDFGGFLYALEKGVVLGGASGCLFVRVMTKDLLAVGTFNLGFRSFVAVLGEAEDSVVILSLR